VTQSFVKPVEPTKQEPPRPKFIPKAGLLVTSNLYTAKAACMMCVE
jgi:hypothetical protein